MLLTSLLFLSGGIAAGVSLSKQILQKNVKKTSKAVLEKHKKAQQNLFKVSEHKDVSEIQAEKEINRYLVVSNTSLVLTTLGGLVYPPLTIISIPLLIYGSGYILKKAYDTVIKEHRIGVVIVESIAIVGFMVTGHFFCHRIMVHTLFLQPKTITKNRRSFSKKSH
jgi:uncharacterized protein YneF (UPF0154 family)